MKIGNLAVIVFTVFVISGVSVLGKSGDGSVSFESEVVKLAGGFKFTEGPAADAKGDIYFTDIPNNRIHKWSVKDGKLSTFMENTGGANGLYFERQGNLLACAGGAGKVLSVSPKGKVTVLADKYKGKSFNSPNDLWIDPKGGIYFTDPRYGRRDNLPQDGEHVYYLSPDQKKIVRVVDDMVRPNGVIGTPDGKILYVADRGANKTYSYKINADGTLSGKKLFAEKGSDGMTLDEKGNLYVTVDGVLVYDPSGKLINKIEVPETPANVCFGKDKKTLFITARKSLYCVKRAASKAGWRFVSMPDFLNVDTDYPQAGWEDSLSYILKSVKAENPDFLVVAGDLVMGEWHVNKDRKGIEGIRHFADRYYPAWKNRLEAHGLKWYAGIGDHELGDNSWHYKGALEMVAEYKKQFREHLGMPLNGPEHMKGTAFWWRHKNVVFVSVDLFEKGKSNQGVIRAGVTGKQLEWLKGVLKKNEDADHKIVMGHAPCLGPVRKWSSSGLMVVGGRESEFWQAMDANGVDLYLCGEVHAITCTERDGVQQVAHGGLIGYNTRTNYMVVDVYDDRLELTIKEIDMVPSGKKLWQPHNNRPLEKVDITPAIKKRGFIPVGKLTIDKSGKKKTFEKPQGYFLKKFDTSTEVGRPIFWHKGPSQLPRINLDGTVERVADVSVKKSVARPNLIVILTDDQGYGDVGCYGAEGFKTPVLDKMADEGVRFTSFYAAPWCSPSRASFMTGCHYQRVGVTCPINSPELGLNPGEVTIAEYLKASGYATALIGKWHLGLHESMSPAGQGFDYFSGIPLSHIRYGKTEHTDGPKAYYRRQWRKTQVGKKDEVEFDPDEVLFTQRITKESLDFIKANKDKPFFLFMSHAQVHYEVLASKGFKGKSRKGVWGDAIQEIDWSVGEVLKTLRKLGIEKDTLVVFVSDNGPQHKDGSAGPLRGRKGSTLEGGSRVPCIMRWPGKIGEGIVCEQVASIMDIFPTFASLLGGRMPAGRVIDGKNIWPLMTKAGATSPHDAYYYYNGNYGKFQKGDDTSATLAGVRSGAWKLHLEKNGKWSLYNLDTDVGETTDVSNQHPEVRRRLERLLEKGRADLGDIGVRGAGARKLGKVSEEEGRRVGRIYRGD